MCRVLLIISDSDGALYNYSTTSSSSSSTSFSSHNFLNIDYICRILIVWARCLF